MDLLTLRSGTPNPLPLHTTTSDTLHANRSTLWDKATLVKPILPNTTSGECQKPRCHNRETLENAMEGAWQFGCCLATSPAKNELTSPESLQITIQAPWQTVTQLPRCQYTTSVVHRPLEAKEQTYLAESLSFHSLGSAVCRR